MYVGWSVQGDSLAWTVMVYIMSRERERDAARRARSNHLEEHKEHSRLVKSWLAPCQSFTTVPTPSSPVWLSRQSPTLPREKLVRNLFRRSLGAGLSIIQLGPTVLSWCLLSFGRCCSCFVASNWLPLTVLAHPTLISWTRLVPPKTLVLYVKQNKISPLVVVRRHVEIWTSADDHSVIMNTLHYVGRLCYLLRLTSHYKPPSCAAPYYTATYVSLTCSTSLFALYIVSLFRFRQEALLWQRDYETRLQSMNDLDIHTRSSQLLLLNGRTAYHFLFVDCCFNVFN